MARVSLFVWIVGLLCVVAPVTGIAQEGTPVRTAVPSEDPEVQALWKRVEAFWQAKVKEDYAAEFSFIEPRVRQRLKLTAYIQGKGWVDYAEFKVEGVKVDGPHGEADVRFVALVRPPIPAGVRYEPKPKTFLATERWVKVGDEWFRRYDQEPAKDTQDQK